MQAVLFYTMSIEATSSLPSVALSPNDVSQRKAPSLEAVCLANRSACFLKLGHHDKALSDASSCVELDPGYIKGHFRKGLALHAQGSYKDAITSFAEAKKIEPKNKQVKDAMKFSEVKFEKEMRQRMQAV